MEVWGFVCGFFGGIYGSGLWTLNSQRDPWGPGGLRHERIQGCASSFKTQLQCSNRFYRTQE